MYSTEQDVKIPSRIYSAVSYISEHSRSYQSLYFSYDLSYYSVLTRLALYVGMV